MAKKKEPARKGRPPVEIDLDLLEKLRMVHLTQEEIAAVFGCTRRTLINRLKDPDVLLAYDNGILKGKANLRRLQWRLAQGLDHNGRPVRGSMSSAVNMAIHLSKHWLGETDKTTPPVSNNVQTHNTLAVNVEGSGARERVTAKLAALSERIESRVVELAAESGASLLPREPIAGRD